jgi:acyl-CoA reductase-like NAD-dependent aldehyde dehydrogenase
LIERDAVTLANLETIDNGKTFEDSIFDIQASCDVFRYVKFKFYSKLKKINFMQFLFSYYAGFADKIHGNTIPTDGNMFSYTRKEPIGVVGQIIPWNYPFMMV